AQLDVNRKTVTLTKITPPDPIMLASGGTKTINGAVVKSEYDETSSTVRLKDDTDAVIWTESTPPAASSPVTLGGKEYNVTVQENHDVIFERTEPLKLSDVTGPEEVVYTGTTTTINEVPVKNELDGGAVKLKVDGLEIASLTDTTPEKAVLLGETVYMAKKNADNSASLIEIAGAKISTVISRDLRISDRGALKKSITRTEGVLTESSFYSGVRGKEKVKKTIEYYRETGRAKNISFFVYDTSRVLNRVEKFLASDGMALTGVVFYGNIFNVPGAFVNDATGDMISTYLKQFESKEQPTFAREFSQTTGKITKDTVYFYDRMKRALKLTQTLAYDYVVNAGSLPFLAGGSTYATAPATTTDEDEISMRSLQEAGYDGTRGSEKIQRTASFEGTTIAAGTISDFTIFDAANQVFTAAIQPILSLARGRLTEESEYFYRRPGTWAGDYYDLDSDELSADSEDLDFVRRKTYGIGTGTGEQIMVYSGSEGFESVRQVKTLKGLDIKSTTFNEKDPFLGSLNLAATFRGGALSSDEKLSFTYYEGYEGDEKVTIVKSWSRDTNPDNLDQQVLESTAKYYYAEDGALIRRVIERYPVYGSADYGKRSSLTSVFEYAGEKGKEKIISDTDASGIRHFYHYYYDPKYSLNPAALAENKGSLITVVTTSEGSLKDMAPSFEAQVVSRNLVDTVYSDPNYNPTSDRTTTFTDSEGNTIMVIDRYGVVNRYSYRLDYDSSGAYLGIRKDSLDRIEETTITLPNGSYSVQNARGMKTKFVDMSKPTRYDAAGNALYDALGTDGSYSTSQTGTVHEYLYFKKNAAGNFVPATGVDDIETDEKGQPVKMVERYWELVREKVSETPAVAPATTPTPIYWFHYVKHEREFRSGTLFKDDSRTYSPQGTYDAALGYWVPNFPMEVNSSSTTDKFYRWEKNEQGAWVVKGVQDESGLKDPSLFALEIDPATGAVKNSFENYLKVTYTDTDGIVKARYKKTDGTWTTIPPTSATANDYQREEQYSQSQLPDQAGNFDFFMHSLAESYVDANNNDQWDPGEIFSDTNSNGAYDKASSDYMVYVYKGIPDQNGASYAGMALKYHLDETTGTMTLTELNDRLTDMVKIISGAQGPATDAGLHATETDKDRTVKTPLGTSDFLTNDYGTQQYLTQAGNFFLVFKSAPTSERENVWLEEREARDYEVEGGYKRTEQANLVTGLTDQIFVRRGVIPTSLMTGASRLVESTAPPLEVQMEKLQLQMATTTTKIDKARQIRDTEIGKVISSTVTDANGLYKYLAMVDRGQVDLEYQWEFNQTQKNIKDGTIDKSLLDPSVAMKNTLARNIVWNWASIGASTGTVITTLSGIQTGEILEDPMLYDAFNTEGKALLPNDLAWLKRNTVDVGVAHDAWATDLDPVAYPNNLKHSLQEFKDWLGLAQAYIAGYGEFANLKGDLEEYIEDLDSQYEEEMILVNEDKEDIDNNGRLNQAWVVATDENGKPKLKAKYPNGISKGDFDVNGFLKWLDEKKNNNIFSECISLLKGGKIYKRDTDGNKVYVYEDLNLNGVLEPWEDTNGNGDLDMGPLMISVNGVYSSADADVVGWIEAVTARILGPVNPVDGYYSPMAGSAVSDIVDQVFTYRDEKKTVISIFLNAGEDLDLDGILDAGEDANGNGALDAGLNPTFTVDKLTEKWDKTKNAWVVVKVQRPIEVFDEKNKLLGQIFLAENGVDISGYNLPEGYIARRLAGEIVIDQKSASGTITYNPEDCLVDGVLSKNNILKLRPQQEDPNEFIEKARADFAYTMFKQKEQAQTRYGNQVEIAGMR
ncbi:MAG: hypothetical protein COT00_00565, partial [Candidatus Omnitrophica bacterium CG07_land_8_20_14_0_80_50_8]